MKIDEQTQRRFWKHVKRTAGCWLWQGARTKKGYGTFKYEGKPVLAHRFSYILHTNEEPGEWFVLHSCDNPSCVNPHHLCKGTHQENMEDRSVRLRAAKKLTPRVARTIYQARGTHREIAARFGVSHTTVGHIKRKETWMFITHER